MLALHSIEFDPPTVATVIGFDVEGKNVRFPSLHATHDKGMDMRKSTASEWKVSPELRLRLREALVRRLYPETGLHRKVVAFDIGAHRDSFERWASGEGEPSGGMLAALVRYFWDRGDRAFAAEVLGLDIELPCAQVIADAVVTELRKRGAAA